MISLVILLSSAVLTKQLGCHATVLRDIPSVMIDDRGTESISLRAKELWQHVLMIIINNNKIMMINNNKNNNS